MRTAALILLTAGAVLGWTHGMYEWFTTPWAILIGAAISVGLYIIVKKEQP